MVCCQKENVSLRAPTSTPAWEIGIVITITMCCHVESAVIDMCFQYLTEPSLVGQNQWLVLPGSEDISIFIYSKTATVHSDIFEVVHG